MKQRCAIDAGKAGEFDRAAAALVRWQDAARELVAAGNCVYRRFELVIRRQSNAKRRLRSSTYIGLGVLMMLYGLAAENLLKALLIARGEAPARGGVLRKFFAKHCLLRYADHARFPLEDAERALLGQMERAIEVGRYPVATDATKTMSLWIVVANAEEETRPSDPTQPRIIALLERLESEIRRLKPQRLLPPVPFARLGIADVRTGGTATRMRTAR